MNRREFVSTTLATGGALLTGGIDTMTADQTPATASPSGPLEFYELRQYAVRRGPSQQRVDTFLRTALLPGLTRAGLGPVGVFTVMIGPGNPTFHVLIPHKSADSFSALPERLAADPEYQKAGADYLDTAAANPAFVRIETSFLRAFSGMPVLELPFGGGENARRPRIFEMRIYESHSEMASRKKRDMFNNGEIAIFRKAGLMPVFFGETLAGPRMPNLVYMLVYEDMAAHDRQWAAFAADPAWRALSSTPGLTDPDIVTSITNFYLRPAAYSQI